MKKNTLEILKKTKNELSSPEDIKMKIREYIDKLNDTSTRDLYFKNFKTLLLTYTDENSVNIIFNLLLTYTNDGMTLIGKEYQIILVAYALNINYIKNMTYTILNKILKAISLNLERYNNFEIQKACSVVTIEIFDQITKMGENHENAFSFIIKFYLDLIEKNRAIVSQPKDNGILNGSFIIISDLLSYIINLNSKNDIEESNPNVKNEGIEQINRKIERDEIEKASTLNSLQKILEETLFNLINKFISFKYANPFLIESITYLIDMISFEDYKNKIKEIIPHTNKVLYDTNAKLYLSKVMICHLYSHLFRKPQFIEDKNLIEEIIKALNYITKDRVVKVQIAAEEALLLYNNLNKNTNNIKTERKMSKLNLLRNLSKINKEKNNIMSSVKVRKEIYDIGIGKFLRSNDYLNNRDEENLLMLKKGINRSKSKSKEKNKSKKRFKKFKGNSDNKIDGGIMIFQRFNGFSEEISKENDLNNKIKSSKENNFMRNLKNEDINLNDDIESIQKSLTKKEKVKTENTETIENEEDDKEKIQDEEQINNKQDINNLNNKQNSNINININHSLINENINNNEKEKEKEQEKEQDIEKEKKDKKVENLFNFKEEENNIGDQATPNFKEEENNIVDKTTPNYKENTENISEKKIKNKSKRNKKLNSKEISETNEKFGNSNNDLNFSDNNDSSNIQGNTLEEINKINTISKRSSKYKIKNVNSINNRYNNETLNQLKNMFNEELDKLMNNFNNNANVKLNKINSRLLGLSQNINRIKTNLNLLKHTNNLNFKDSNVIINEEKEEQSLESSMTKNEDKYNIKSYNILWETITLYIKSENYEEAYIKALQGGDDIIFLRLIFSMGTSCLPLISINTNKLILKHFNSIFRTFSLQNQFLEYIKAFYNMKMLNTKYFTLEELNDFMQTLFEIKTLKNDTGKQAQILYNNILNNFSSIK